MMIDYFAAEKKYKKNPETINLMRICLQSFILLFGALIVPNAAYAQGLHGDVNGDREVNIADVNALIDAIMASNTSNRAFDVNKDGETNVGDINARIDLILGH